MNLFEDVKYPPVRTCIENSVALLDEMRPGWRDSIDSMDDFNIQDAKCCILEKVFWREASEKYDHAPGYGTGAGYHHGMSVLDGWQRTDLAFAANGDYRRTMFNKLWREVVTGAPVKKPAKKREMVCVT